MVKYDNYYVDKEQYTFIYNFINDPTILQTIDKLTTYEFISYKGRIMYKLEETVIEKLEDMNYPIKYIDELEHYKLKLEKVYNSNSTQKNENIIKSTSTNTLDKSCNMPMY